MSRHLPIAATAALALAAPVWGQVLTHEADQPSLDRWNYPFNFTPGMRASASTFGANFMAGFDDRDAQFIVGFDTGSSIPVGLAPGDYQVISLRVTAAVSNDVQFRYDPTADGLGTFLDPATDLDPGRPIELFAVGYRNGFELATWKETSSWGGTAMVEPSQGARNAFVATFDAGGAAIDASNSLKDGSVGFPMALATTDTVVPGDLVPVDSRFVFEVLLCDGQQRRYVQEALAFGRLNLAISTLEFVSNSDEGPPVGDPEYPIWYTRENPIAQILGLTPTIELVVRVGSPGDYNGDGLKDFFDVSAFLSDFAVGSPAADLDGDCVTDFFDVSAFLAAFATP